MADICVNSTGEVFYGIDNGVVLVLLTAFPEVFSRAVKAKPAVPPTVAYKVGPSPSGTLTCIIRIFGASVEYFDGDPKGAKQWRGDVPDEVIAEYKRQRGR